MEMCWRSLKILMEMDGNRFFEAKTWPFSASASVWSRFRGSLSSRIVDLQNKKVDSQR